MLNSGLQKGVTMLSLSVLEVKRSKTDTKSSRSGKIKFCVVTFLVSFLMAFLEQKTDLCNKYMI